jgi:hypothetical protein
MTICIALKLRDGLILASDSAVTITSINRISQQEQYINTFSHAKKIKHFKDYPIGIMQWGEVNSIENTDILQLIEQYERKYRSIKDYPDYSVKDIAIDITTELYKRCINYLDLNNREKDKIDLDEIPTFGLFFGGFSNNSYSPECLSIRLPLENLPDPADPDFRQILYEKLQKEPTSVEYGPSWFGMTSDLVRLFYGYDHFAFEEVQDELKELFNEQEFAKLKKILESYITRAAFDIRYDVMPIQDGINFVCVLINFVIDMCKFKNTPYCGIPINLCVILPNDFRWISKISFKVPVGMERYHSR